MSWILLSRIIHQIPPQCWGPADSLEREVWAPSHHRVDLIFSLFWYPKTHHPHCLCTLCVYVYNHRIHSIVQIVLWFCQPDLFVFGVWDVSTPKVQPSGLMSHDLMSQRSRLPCRKPLISCRYYNQKLVWKKDFEAWLPWLSSMARFVRGVFYKSYARGLVATPTCLTNRVWAQARSSGPVTAS